MRLLMAALLLAALGCAKSEIPPEKVKVKEVEVKIFQIEGDGEKYIGTAGAKFTLGSENPEMKVYTRSNNSVAFDDKIKAEFSMREVVEDRTEFYVKEAPHERQEGLP